MTLDEIVSFYDGKTKDDIYVQQRAAQDIFLVLAYLQIEKDMHQITQECYMNSCQKLLTANSQLARINIK